MPIAKSHLEDWYSRAADKGLLKDWGGIGAGGKAPLSMPDDLIFPSSVCSVDGDVLALIKLPEGSALAVAGENRAGFRGRKRAGRRLTICPLSSGNASKLRSLLPFTAPIPLGDRGATLGLGDRLGITSPGHIRLVRRVREKGLEGVRDSLAPVLAQQSVRELNLTSRNYREVLDAATWAVFQEGYRAGWGADGDHLKSASWVKKALAIGYTMITADVSDYIENPYAEAAESEVMAAYRRRIPEKDRRTYEERYRDLSLAIDTGERIRFSAEELARIVLIYGKAASYAAKLYRAGASTGKKFDFELSIDETQTPTLPQAHVFMATEMRERGVPLTSLAPRFVGEFQKGIDYIGSPEEFEASFRIHAAIARAFGYRLSVHSGSDKFLVFPIVGRETGYRFHLKTAGTNWLQALLVIAEKDFGLFASLYREILERFPRARKYYHITPDLGNIPSPEELSAETVGDLFRNPDARQVLHVTYGELLRDGKLRTKIYRVLSEHMAAYWLSLEEHIEKHCRHLGLIA